MKRENDITHVYLLSMLWFCLLRRVNVEIFVFLHKMYKMDMRSVSLSVMLKFISVFVMLPFHTLH